MSAITKDDITAVVLTGGTATRLQGRNKGLIEIDNFPLIQHITTQLALQTDHLLISANQDIKQYEQFATVIQDREYTNQGPLAGILQACKQAETPYIITVPGDAPYITEHYIEKMLECLNHSDNSLCVATDEFNKLQPVYSLIPTTLKEDLSLSLSLGHNKVASWLQQHKPTYCRFMQSKMFFNINTPSDLEKAQLDVHP